MKPRGCTIVREKDLRGRLGVVLHGVERRCANSPERSTARAQRAPRTVRETPMLGRYHGKRWSIRSDMNGIHLAVSGIELRPSGPRPEHCFHPESMEPAASERPPQVRFRGITKRFPGGVLANDDISFDIEKGEIHALLGENGAGKTTLMGILAGLHQPDEGYIQLKGERVVFRSPRDAKRHGIGMVHQHFSLVPAFTVAENLALSGGTGGPLFKPRSWSEHLRAEAERLGFDIRPEAYVWELSMGERQRVEVFRLFLEGAKAVINLDEPTSILAPHEAEKLFEHMARFKEAGGSVFLVTHKIDHVLSFADRVTVLRRGRVVASRDVSEVSRDGLADLMVGRHISESPARWAIPRDQSEPPWALEVHSLSVGQVSCPRGLEVQTLTVAAGGIVGVAGVGGSGQDELVAAITRTVPFRGTIRRRGRRGASEAPRLGHVSGDRLGEGIAGSLSLADNLCLRSFHEDGFAWGPFLLRKKMRNKARQLIGAFGISPGDPDAPASTLSGGNLQRVVLARELERDPDLLVAVTPTAGLDIAGVEYVHSQLVSMAANGCGVLLISEDLDELLLLCDRIVVLAEGNVVGDLLRPDFDRRRIGLLMSGSGGDNMDGGAETGVRHDVA